MICEPCAEAADGTEPRIAECPECRKLPLPTWCPDGEEILFSHSREVFVWERSERIRERCPGSKKPPKFTSGHELCKGCSCHHKPKGSWNHHAELSNV